MPERAIAFSAEEAKEEDVTEEQAKGALVDAGMSGEKLAAITTGDDAVNAKEVATWAAKHGGDNVAEVVESRLPSWAPSARYTKARRIADRLRR